MSGQKEALDAIMHRNDGIELRLTGAKFAIFSDLHLGDKSNADNFKTNEKAFVSVLEYYKKENYQLILLGDIEELWQFDLTDIVKSYKQTIYRQFQEFGEGRVFRIFGNHDIDFAAPIDPLYHAPEIRKGAAEFIKMRDDAGKTRILLLHGHQGTTDADKKSWLSRAVVRGIWTPIERILPSLNDLLFSPAATNSPILSDYERELYAWAKTHKMILICGHSHRAIFAASVFANKLQAEIGKLQLEIHTSDRHDSEIIAKKIKAIDEKRRQLQEELVKGRDIGLLDDADKLKPCYFNSGCAVYANGFTNIEIADGEIRLRKWNRKDTAQASPEDYGHGALNEILEKVAS